MNLDVLMKKKTNNIDPKVGPTQTIRSMSCAELRLDETKRAIVMVFTRAACGSDNAAWASPGNHVGVATVLPEYLSVFTQSKLEEFKYQINWARVSRCDSEKASAPSTGALLKFTWNCGRLLSEALLVAVSTCLTGFSYARHSPTLAVFEICVLVVDLK